MTAPEYNDRPQRFSRLVSAVFAGLLLLPGLHGCSTQGAFDLLRGWQATQCRRLPPSEQQRCMEGVPAGYEQYKAERERTQSR